MCLDLWRSPEGSIHTTKVDTESDSSLELDLDPECVVEELPDESISNESHIDPGDIDDSNHDLNYYDASATGC